MKNILIDKIIDIAKNQGFSTSYEVNGNNVHFIFSQYTDFGQDFNFEVTMKNNDIYTLIEDVNNYYEGYDPDEETMLWVGTDGHGRNGAPYRLSDVLKDMEQCERMIEKFLEALIDANNKESLWKLSND